MDDFSIMASAINSELRLSVRKKIIKPAFDKMLPEIKQTFMVALENEICL